jgi:hypothetical protein
MRRVLLFVAAMALAGSFLAASETIPTQFREVVADATLIVRGHVTDVRAFVAPGGDVQTAATVAVDSVIKGQPDTFVSVRVPGGEIGRYRYVMVGAPTFRVGESAVFFLKQGSDNAWRPIGLTMGVFRVQADPSTGRAVVHPPVVSGSTSPGRGPVVRGDSRRQLMPVSDFESLVRLVIASPRNVAIPRGGR